MGGPARSLGVFFSMLIIGLSSTLPGTLSSGLQSHGLSSQIAGTISHEPPVGSLFAAFLGANPIGNLLGHLPASDLRGADVSTLTSKEYFPQLISGPFHHGLVIVFSVAVVMYLIGAAASLMRGGRYVHEDLEPVATEDIGVEDQTTPISVQ